MIEEIFLVQIFFLKQILKQMIYFFDCLCSVVGPFRPSFSFLSIVNAKEASSFRVNTSSLIHFSFLYIRRFLLPDFLTSFHRSRSQSATEISVTLLCVCDDSRVIVTVSICFDKKVKNTQKNVKILQNKYFVIIPIRVVHCVQ